MAYDDVLKELARLPRDTIVLQISIFADAAGRRFFQNELAEGIAAASSAPVYSALSIVLGRGPVGGYMHSFEDQGTAAADIALEILAGKDPATLPRQTRPPHKYMVDANALKRWDMDEAALSPGATVLFKQPTVWDQYRPQIIAVFAIVLLQAALIAWLLFERDSAPARGGASRQSESGERATSREVSRIWCAFTWSARCRPRSPMRSISRLRRSRTMPSRRAAGFRADSADPKVEELLDKIEEQASRAGDVLNSLRAMVKKHDSERAKTEVGPLGQRCPETRRDGKPQRRHPAGIRDRAGLPPVFVDGIQIQQVVLNLTRNAIEAMDGTGHTGTVKVGVAGNGHGEIAVSVADSGPGIAPDDAQRIFDPFYSTKEAGLGVGLSISRAIIEAHGGRLSLTPNAGGGSIFRFTLPAMKERS